jgi:hypothetical protein
VSQDRGAVVVEGAVADGLRDGERGDAAPALEQRPAADGSRVIIPASSVSLEKTSEARMHLISGRRVALGRFG